jgi:hypothetical protein
MFVSTISQLKVQIFMVSGKIRRTLMPFPPVNYCDIMSGRLTPVATLRMIVDELAKFGNLLGPCPMKPGQYYLKDYTMDETASVVTRMMQEKDKFLSNFTVTDENSGRPVLITSYQVLFSCNHSNWHQ